MSELTTTLPPNDAPVSFVAITKFEHRFTWESTDFIIKHFGGPYLTEVSHEPGYVWDGFSIGRTRIKNEIFCGYAHIPQCSSFSLNGPVNIGGISRGFSIGRKGYNPYPRLIVPRKRDLQEKDHFWNLGQGDEEPFGKICSMDRRDHMGLDLSEVFRVGFVIRGDAKAITENEAFELCRGSCFLVLPGGNVKFQSNLATEIFFWSPEYA